MFGGVTVCTVRGNDMWLTAKLGQHSAWNLVRFQRLLRCGDHSFSRTGQRIPGTDTAALVITRGGEESKQGHTGMTRDNDYGFPAEVRPYLRRGVNEGMDESVERVHGLVRGRTWLRAMTAVLVGPGNLPPIPHSARSDATPPVDEDTLAGRPQTHLEDGRRTDGREQPVFARDTHGPFRASETLISPAEIGVLPPMKPGVESSTHHTGTNALTRIAQARARTAAAKRRLGGQAQARVDDSTTKAPPSGAAVRRKLNRKAREATRRLVQAAPADASAPPTEAGGEGKSQQPPPVPEVAAPSAIVEAETSVEEQPWLIDLTKWSGQYGPWVPWGTPQCEAYCRHNGVEPVDDGRNAHHASRRVWFPRIRGFDQLELVAGPKGLAGESATSKVHKARRRGVAALDREPDEVVAVKMSVLPTGLSRYAELAVLLRGVVVLIVPRQAGRRNFYESGFSNLPNSGSSFATLDSRPSRPASPTRRPSQRTSLLSWNSRPQRCFTS